MTLSPEKMQSVYAIQRSMFDKFKNVPAEGTVVDYLGKPFIVYPGTFWPSEDSKALVKNYRINPREEVCDVCTGSGVIAIHSAWKGASRVVALDINPEALRSARENVHRYDLSKVVDVRLSDVFSGLKPKDTFDVVTMNSPFTDHKEETEELVEKTIWDTGLHVQNEFFTNLDKVLKPYSNARAYITQASFGAIHEMRDMAYKSGFNLRCIGENHVDDLRTFYAFELTRRKK